MSRREGPEEILSFQLLICERRRDGKRGSRRKPNKEMGRGGDEEIKRRREEYRVEAC
jgi:hypothetical protein